MTDDTTAIQRRLDGVERNASDQAKSITAILEEVRRLERVLADSTTSDATTKWLTDLRDDEVETLKELGEMGEEQRQLVFAAIELTKSIRRTGRFMKWTAIGVLSLFVFANTFSEQVLKFWSLIQGAPR